MRLKPLGLGLGIIKCKSFLVDKYTITRYSYENNFYQHLLWCSIRNSSSNNSSSTFLHSMAESDTYVEAEVCAEKDLAVGKMKEVDVGESKALLIRDASGFHAIGHKCSHYGAPLVKGALGNGHVRCPWHGACFNYKTGDIEDFPGLDSVPKHEVVVDSGKVLIRVNKSDIGATKRQKTMVPAESTDNRSFVIVGGGPASLTCAETLRQEGFTGNITILSKDTNITYDRPKLSKAMTSKADEIALRKSDFYTSNSIQFKVNSEVASVDVKTSSVKLKNGSSVKYDKLLLATGATPRNCTFVTNHQLDNVLTLRTVEDANIIAEKAKDKNVVIIGTSFIGVEVAACLADKAASVRIIDLVEAPFQLALGKQVGNAMKKLLEEKGIKFHFNNSVVEFKDEEGKLTKAVLKDGTVLDADVCVAGIGVTPTTEFLDRSGVEKTDLGFVTVNKNMQTNCENVYAAGDITFFPLFMAHNKSVNIQHWQMAHQQGRVAALNMIGKKTDIKSVPYFWTVIFGKSLRYCGYGVGYDDIIIHGDLDELKFVAYYTKGKDVIAVASLNHDPVVSSSAEILLSGKPFKKEWIKDGVLM